MSTWFKKQNKNTSRQHIDGRDPVIFQQPGGRGNRSGYLLVELRCVQADWSMWRIQGLLLAQQERNTLKKTKQSRTKTKNSSGTKIAKEATDSCNRVLTFIQQDSHQRVF